MAETVQEDVPSKEPCPLLFLVCFNLNPEAMLLYLQARYWFRCSCVNKEAAYLLSKLIQEAHNRLWETLICVHPLLQAAFDYHGILGQNRERDILIPRPFREPDSRCCQMWPGCIHRLEALHSSLECEGDMTRCKMCAGDDVCPHTTCLGLSCATFTTEKARVDDEHQVDYRGRREMVTFERNIKIQRSKSSKFVRWFRVRLQLVWTSYYNYDSQEEKYKRERKSRRNLCFDVCLCNRKIESCDDYNWMQSGNDPAWDELIELPLNNWDRVKELVARFLEHPWAFTEDTDLDVGTQGALPIPPDSD